ELRLLGAHGVPEVAAHKPVRVAGARSNPGRGDACEPLPGWCAERPSDPCFCAVVSFGDPWGEGNGELRGKHLAREGVCATSATDRHEERAGWRPCPHHDADDVSGRAGRVTIVPARPHAATAPPGTAGDCDVEQDADVVDLAHDEPDAGGGWV